MKLQAILEGDLHDTRHLQIALPCTTSKHPPESITLPRQSVLRVNHITSSYSLQFDGSHSFLHISRTKCYLQVELCHFSVPHESAVITQIERRRGSGLSSHSASVGSGCTVTRASTSFPTVYKPRAFHCMGSQSHALSTLFTA